jgi:hypothetical protein
MSGFYPDPSGGTVCLACSSQIANCVTCQMTPNFACLTCAAGSFWTGSICEVCSVPNCLTASYISSQCQCTQCMADFLSDGNGNCVACYSTMPNCQECSSTSVCTKCDSSLQFYLNSTSKCETCNILGCTTCASLTTCLTCDTANDYFLNSNDICEKCSLNQCTDC